jgi:hypothetical protein
MYITFRRAHNVQACLATALPCSTAWSPAELSYTMFSAVNRPIVAFAKDSGRKWFNGLVSKCSVVSSYEACNTIPCGPHQVSLVRASTNPGCKETRESGTPISVQRGMQHEGWTLQHFLQSINDSCYHIDISSVSEYFSTTRACQS